MRAARIHAYGSLLVIDDVPDPTPLLVPNTRHLVGLGELDPIQAAPLTDAALTPYRAVRCALRDVSPDGAVALIGFGGLGQYALQITRLFSPAQVFVVEPHVGKRSRAVEHGADAAIDPNLPAAADAAPGG